MWQPHWRLAKRQELWDGVCVAELIVAVKHRLNERQLAARGDRLAGRGPGFFERFAQRKGLHVVSAIVGNATEVRMVLWAPFDNWPHADRHSPGQPRADRPAAMRRFPDQSAPADWIPPTRDRVRWLPWQARTASWQAAYNAACLYAELVQEGLADEEQVIVSLRRVVLNRDSGMERPTDWISNDPDLAPLVRHDSPYQKVRAFLEAQERRDYPMRQVHQHVQP